MTDIGARFAAFIAELQRRQVLRTLGIYAITVWVVIALAANTFVPLNVPVWIHTALIIALIAGFPVVAVLAWVFDITTQGIIRTEPAEYEARLNEFGEAIAERPRLWFDVVVITVLLGLIVYLLIRPGEPVQVTPAPSIAVLPFLDISEHGDNRYFSDGMTEALISTLARLPGLKVASATSSFSYTGAKPDIKSVGERLGVATVLEGSVRKDADNRLKITAQLIDVATDTHLWSATYDGHLDDIFAVQEDIARSIARELRIRLLPESDRQLAAPVTDHIDAYDLYLRGRGSLYQAWTRANLERAIRYFNDALLIDPLLAQADVGLCSAYRELYEHSRDADFLDHALDACNAARARLPDDADMHAAFGAIYFGTRRDDHARDEFLKALAIDEAHPEALRGLGRVLWRMGEREAGEAMVRRALESDPGHWRAHLSLGVMLMNTGRLDEALAVTLAGIAHDPRHPNLYNNLGAVYGMMGDFAKAADAFGTAVEIEPEPIPYENLGNNLFYIGRFEEAHGMYTKAIGLSPGIHGFHMRLGDVCRHLAEAHECGRHYKVALDLAQQRVRIAPEPQVMADLAVLYTLVGDEAAAGRVVEQVTSRWPDDYLVSWSLARIALISGDHDAALDHLAAARANGYPPAILSVHPDLEPLRGSVRFDAIIDGVHGSGT